MSARRASSGSRVSARYRGSDRRGTFDTSAAPLGRLFMAAGGALVVFMVLFAVGPLMSPGTGILDATLLRLQLSAASVAVGVLAGVLCFVRWRMTGEAATLYLSAACLVFAIGTIGAGHLLSLVEFDAVEAAVIDWVHPASRLAVMWLLFLGLRAPAVDSRLRLWRVLLMGTAATAVLALAFQLSPRLLAVLGSSADRLVTSDIPSVHPGSIVLTTGWMALGVAFATRGVRRERWLFAWFGLCFFALALTEVLRIPTYPPGSVWLAGSSSLRFMALLLAVTGATRELVRAFGEQQDHLLESVKSGMTSRARLEAEKRAVEERAHEARNALTAIEGATRTLEHYRDRLDEETRAGLSEAITREIARLQQLVSAEHVMSQRGQFRLAEVVAAMVTAARSHDTVVHVEVPEDLTAFGRPGETGQVVQNLMENARHYAPGSPIYLRAERVSNGVVLRVEDEGPGVALSERGAIFKRGHRGSAGDAVQGSGLGLYVSAQLMHEQGGDLWLDERPDGGASFALQLPDSEASARLVEEGVDEAEDVVEARGSTALLDAGGPDDPDDAVARSLGEHEHDIRREA